MMDNRCLLMNRCIWDGTPESATTRAQFAPKPSHAATASANISAATTEAWNRSSAPSASDPSRDTFCSTCVPTPTRSRSVAKRAIIASLKGPLTFCLLATFSDENVAKIRNIWIMVEDWRLKKKKTEDSVWFWWDLKCNGCDFAS